MDLNTINQRLTNLQSQGGNREKIDYKTIFWKPKVGKSIVRIVPSKFDKDNPFKEVFMHYNFQKFPLMSLTNWGEKDPIVEFASELRKTDDKNNWSLAGKISPKMRVFVPIIVRGEEDKGVRLWEFGKQIYEQLLKIAKDPDYGDYTDINEGRDITVEGVEDTVMGRKAIKCSVIMKPNTSPISDDADYIKSVLENQPNILEIRKKHSFDELKEVLQKWLTAKEEAAEGEEEDSSDASEKSEYSLENKAKQSTSDKFDDLFPEEEESN